jgi:polyisoprenoid-binding protein YceI
MSATQTLSLTRTLDSKGVEIPAPGVYAIDPAHSQVGFVVKHMMVSKVRGRFSDFSGRITIAEEPTDSSVEVTVHLDSVDTRDAKRDEHLRSSDFFSIDEHPTMTYRSTSVQHLKADRWLVDGELTLLGVSRPLALEVEFEGAAKDPWGGTRIGFSAKGEVNREDYGMTFNAALETGGVLVGKKATIEIEAEAVLQ